MRALENNPFRGRPALAGAAAFALGAAVCGRLSLFFLTPPFTAAGSLVCLLLAFISIARKDLFRIFFCTAAFLTGFSLCGMRFEKIRRALPEDAVSLAGTVCSTPLLQEGDWRSRRLRFDFNVESVRSLRQDWGTTEALVRVGMPAARQEIACGDRLVLRGNLRFPPGARNPGGFDQKEYFEREGIAARFLVRNEGDCRVLSREGRRSLPAVLERLRRRLARLIEAEIPPPESGVVKALIIGLREDLSPDLKDDFARSGTAHVLAISGLHVALIASLFFLVLSLLRLPRPFVLTGTILLLFLYAAIAGASASVVRSTVMITIHLLGLLLRRESDLLTSLAWSALLILFWNPLQIFDPGFQLSYLAVLGIALLLPTLDSKEESSEEEELERLVRSKREGCRKFLSAALSLFKLSLACWLMVLPVIARNFFLFSPVTIPANLAVVPYADALIAASLAFLLLGGWQEWLAQILGGTVWFLAKGFIFLCHGFASLPFSHFYARPPSASECLLYYLLLALWFCLPSLRNGAKRWLWLIFFLNLPIWRSTGLSSPRELRMTFLDVGHGDACVMELPGGGALLVDTGAGGRWDQGRFTVASFLRSRGIDRLEAIFISHPHSDHAGGLPYLLKEFPVGALLDNGGLRVVPSGFVRRVLRQGDKISFADGVEIHVLHPAQKFMQNKKIAANDRSLVLRLRYGRFRALLAGDVEEKALFEICNSGGELKSDLLKVPHHGGDAGAGDLNFLARVDPKIAVISEAEENPFGLPSPRLVSLLRARGARTFQTGRDGAVSVVTDGERISVE